MNKKLTHSCPFPFDSLQSTSPQAMDINELLELSLESLNSVEIDELSAASIDTGSTVVDDARSCKLGLMEIDKDKSDMKIDELLLASCKSDSMETNKDESFMEINELCWHLASRTRWRMMKMSLSWRLMSFLLASCELDSMEIDEDEVSHGD